MLEWIISSSVLAAVLIAVRYIFKGRIRPVVQYAMWALLLIRLLMPFSIGSSFLSVNNILEMADRADKSMAVQEAEIPIDNILPAETDGQSEISAITGIDKAVEEAKKETAVPVQSTVMSNTSTSAAIQPAVLSIPVSKPLTTQQILLIVWAAGSICVLIWFLFCNIRYAVSLRKNRVPMDLENILGESKENPVEEFYKLPVYISSAIETPCLFGLFHPAVYVTEEVCKNEVTLRHVLTHENMHYKHSDHIWSVLRGICISVHWFNPFIWWAAFLSRRDCELACDEATLNILGESQRTEYGNTLLNLTFAKSSITMLAATTMSGKKSAIYERIKMITSDNKKPVVPMIAALLIIVIAAGCTFTGAADNSVDEQSYVYENGLIQYHYDPETEKWITEDGYEYKYKYTLSAVEHDGPFCYVVLSNRRDVTYSQCFAHENNSSATYQFNEEETVIVDKYYEEAYRFELHIPLDKNGGTVISANVSDSTFSLRYRYPEDLSEDGRFSNNCANMTGLRLKDGTRIRCVPKGGGQELDIENQQTFFHQSISLDGLIEQNPSLSEKQISLTDIEAVYIAEWDPELNDFDTAHEIEIVLKEADIRTQFLKWRFTSNLNDRWTIYQEIYQDEINTIMAEMIIPEQEEVPVGIIVPDQDMQTKIKAATDEYYSEISGFTSDDFINRMISNRTPMSEDEYCLAVGMESEFVDVAFGEGREDPFVSGLIYDFDGRVIINGPGYISAYPRYPTDEDGYAHITGQITVDDGIITNIYVKLSADRKSGNSSEIVQAAEGQYELTKEHEVYLEQMMWQDYLAQNTDTDVDQISELPEQELTEQFIKRQGPWVCMISEEDINLVNGYYVDSIVFTPKNILMTCCYPEYYWPEQPGIINSCQITGLILTDGTRIDCYPTMYNVSSEPENNRVVQCQFAVISEGVVPDTIDAVCVNVWDPVTQDFSEKEETLSLHLEELAVQSYLTDEITVCDDDKLTVILTGFDHYQSTRTYYMSFRIVNNTDRNMTISNAAVILNGVSVPGLENYILYDGEDTTLFLPVSEEEVMETGIDAIENAGISLVVHLQGDPAGTGEPAEQIEIEYTKEISE